MGFVKIMWAEQNLPSRPGDAETVEPSLEQILDAITALDGAVCSYVMLFPSDEESEIFFTVAGGNDGRYVVAHWDGVEGIEHNLINPAVTSDETVVVIMVHPSIKPAKRVVDLVTAKRMATVYATSGKLADDMPWEKA